MPRPRAPSNARGRRVVGWVEFMLVTLCGRHDDHNTSGIRRTGPRRCSMNDRAAAFHEAGHALVAVHAEVIDLAGPVSIGTVGDGAVALQQNNGQIRALLGEDFEPDDVHRRFILAYLAGPVAERILAEREQLALSEAETNHAGRFDKAMAEERMGRMQQPTGLESYLVATHDLLSDWMWQGVVDFAEELLKERSLSAAEATALARDALRRHKPK
jgi:hypothetical protein